MCSVFKFRTLKSRVGRVGVCEGFSFSVFTESETHSLQNSCSMFYERILLIYIIFFVRNGV